MTLLIALSDRRPAAGPFLRGRVSFVSSIRLRVRYGIEACFSEKREALKWENERRGSRRGVPLEVEIAFKPLPAPSAAYIRILAPGESYGRSWMRMIPIGR